MPSMNMKNQRDPYLLSVTIPPTCVQAIFSMMNYGTMIGTNVRVCMCVVPSGRIYRQILWPKSPLAI